MPIPVRGGGGWVVQGGVGKGSGHFISSDSITGTGSLKIKKPQGSSLYNPSNSGKLFSSLKGMLKFFIVQEETILLYKFLSFILIPL